ncbi:MAG: 3,4-dihydroxy-2-butanone-4-phosphate synthase [Thiotrichaceae bacterium]
MRPEDINFMARYGRGLICLTVTQERCLQLRLPLMVNDNQAANGTNFYRLYRSGTGCNDRYFRSRSGDNYPCHSSTGCKTLRFSTARHIFPIMAQPVGYCGGRDIRKRVDLARLSKQPAAVIVEILNEDGNMARRGDLEIFAKQHDIKIGTIADLIHFAQNMKKLWCALLNVRCRPHLGLFN